MDPDGPRSGTALPAHPPVPLPEVVREPDRLRCFLHAVVSRNVASVLSGADPCESGALICVPVSRPADAHLGNLFNSPFHGHRPFAGVSDPETSTEQQHRSHHCEQQPNQIQAQQNRPHGPEWLVCPALSRVPICDSRKSQNQSDHDEHYRQMHGPRLGQALARWAGARPEATPQVAERTQLHRLVAPLGPPCETGQR